MDEAKAKEFLEKNSISEELKKEIAEDCKQFAGKDFTAELIPIDLFLEIFVLLI